MRLKSERNFQAGHGLVAAFKLGQCRSELRVGSGQIRLEQRGFAGHIGSFGVSPQGQEDGASRPVRFSARRRGFYRPLNPRQSLFVAIPLLFDQSQKIQCEDVAWFGLDHLLAQRNGFSEPPRLKFLHRLLQQLDHFEHGQ
jgi:hypothetical protein